MRSVTISVPDNKLDLTVDLVKSLKFVKKVKVEEAEDRPPTKEEFLKNLEAAVKELNEIKAGKRKPVLLKDFLNEL